MKKLILYTKPNCIYCANAKDYLNLLNIDYEEIDVMTDSAIRDKLVAAGHKTLPVIYADDKILVHGGYNALKTMRKEDILERLK